MNSTELNPQKQLDLIEQTITKTKENLSRHSYDFLFWGWLTSLTALINFFGLNFTPIAEKNYLIWAITPLLGGIFIVFRYSKTIAQQKTHLEYFLQHPWMVIGGVFILFTLSIFFINIISPWTFFPVIAGIGALVSGFTLRFAYLNFGGMLLICFPFISLLVNNEWNMLLYAIVIFFAFVLPGYALKRAH